MYNYDMNNYKYSYYPHSSRAYPHNNSYHQYATPYNKNYYPTIDGTTTYSGNNGDRYFPLLPFAAGLAISPLLFRRPFYGPYPYYPPYPYYY